jgi:predicted cobalt transporter CbtA
MPGYGMSSFEGNMTQVTAQRSEPDSAPARPALIQAAARAAYPADYLAGLERLPVPLLRACLADLAHLKQPILLERADRLQMVVTILVQNQASGIGTQAALHAVGATTVVDMQTGSLPTAAEDFRKFAAAIGAPPRLPGLTAAESLMQHGAKQLGNLAISARLGVGLASLAVTERVWQWMSAYIGDLLSRRHGVMAATALNSFATDRRDARLADDLEAMVGGLDVSPMGDRSINFGANQAVAVMTPLFALLILRQQQLIVQGL